MTAHNFLRKDLPFNKYIVLQLNNISWHAGSNARKHETEKSLKMKFFHIKSNLFEN